MHVDAGFPGLAPAYALARMTNKSFNPIHMRLFGADNYSALNEFSAHLIQQARRSSQDGSIDNF